MQARLTRFQEIPGLLAFFKELPDYPAEYFVNKKSKANLENAPQMLEAAIEVLEKVPQWELEPIHDSLMELAQKLLEDNRDSVSGVVVDEEVANMMLYNKSLSAASRLMTAMDEALDTLINKTGMVGR